jgi:23S rRNA (guanosine2251-2'-O)-methyltransferase
MFRKLKNKELNRLNVDEFISTSKTPLLLVLDNVRSAHNVGSVFRTSDAFLLEGVYLCGITATPPHKEIYKTALGATETVSWKHFKEAADCIKQLKEEGYVVISIEQAENAVMLDEFMPEQGKKYALVFGNEVEGVSQELLDLSDNCIEIPQSGSKHSLNIAVSAGVVCWDFVNKMKNGD